MYLLDEKTLIWRIRALVWVGFDQLTAVMILLEHAANF